jgi:signal transduction histidine kinase
LTATVAHEINNPLAYLLANQDFVIKTIERLKPSASPQLAAQLDDLVEAAADAREGAHRIQSVVGELKKFTRTEALEVSPVDVAEVIDSSINMAMPQIKHRAQLVRDVDDVPTVDAHSQRLGQVLLNLLVNAAQSIEEGAYADNEIRVSATTEHGSVVVRVSDTGTGIDPDIRDRIMEPFYTTKPAGEGTGLGLATCRTIVASFGAEMGFDSTVGKGSTFWVRLPISSTRTREADDDGHLEPEPNSQRRVLFIDDERALARACARMMIPHDVTICSSGGEALALLEENTDFDIIFCDRRVDGRCVTV